MFLSFSSTVLKFIRPINIGKNRIICEVGMGESLKLIGGFDSGEDSHGHFAACLFVEV